MTLLFTLQLALFATGFTFIIRALAKDEWKLHKPISCALCSAFWPSFVLGSSFILADCSSFADFLMAAPTTALVVGGATGLGYLLNKIIELIAFQID